MTTRRIVAEEWATFERRILDPLNASEIQRQETRRAFYAGAFLMLARLGGEMSDAAEMSASDEALVDGLAIEKDEWLTALREGRV